MGLSPLLLLSLLTFLKDASSESCQKIGFGVNQPRYLQAFEGSSIRINFSFYYPWKLAENPDVKIFLRWKHFHGKYIYKQNRNFIIEEFKDRLTLNRTEGNNEGVFLIERLRREDATTYFCRVQLRTQNCGDQMFQSIEGTNLTITPATTTQATNTTTITTTVATNTTSSESQPVIPGALVGGVVAGAVLISAILGLLFYLMWKRRKGRKTEDRSPARKCPKITENKQNIENKGHHSDAKLDQKDEGITYVSLALSRLTSPPAPSCHYPHESPQEEIVYSAVKIT